MAQPVVRWSCWRCEGPPPAPSPGRPTVSPPSSSTLRASSGKDLNTNSTINNPCQHKVQIWYGNFLSSFHLELNLKCLSSGGSCEESHLKVWWKKKNCLFQKCEILRKDLQEWWRGSGKLVKNMRVPLRTWGLCCTFRYILPQWGLQLYFPEMWSLCFRTKIELNSAN